MIGRWVTHALIYLSARPDPWRCVDPELLAMFTDLSGSTRTNEQLGDDAWATLMRDPRRTVRELTANLGGKEMTVAARLLEVAEPHEILETEPVADGCDAGVLVDRGLVRLKGVAQPRHLLSVRWLPDAPDGPGPDGPRPSPHRVE